MIDRTKLIKLGLVAVALISVGAFSSWKVTQMYYHDKLSTERAAHASTLKSISDEAALNLSNQIQSNNQLVIQLNQLERKHYDDLQQVLIQNTTYRNAVLSGTKRVQFAEASLATCKQSLHQTASTSSMGNGTSIELSPIAGQTILDIREGILRDQAKLRYLQEFYIKNSASQ